MPVRLYKTRWMKHKRVLFYTIKWQICSLCLLISPQEPPVTPDGNILGEETHIVSLASDGGGVTTPSQDCPFSSQTQVKSQVSRFSYQPTSELVQPEHVLPNQISTLITTVQPKETIKLASCISRSQEEGQKTSWEPAVEQGRGQQAAGPYKNWSSSASLPRGFRRSEGSSRLSTAITARPFGTKPSRVSSLKRYNVSSAKWSLHSKTLLHGGKRTCASMLHVTVKINRIRKWEIRLCF